MEILFTLLGIILIIALVFFCGLATYVVHPRRHTLESSRACEDKQGLIGDFDTLESTHYTIISYDGYELSAQFVPAPEKSDKYVILSHGYTYTRYGSVKYLHQFRRLGYNCVLYDDRGHGANVLTKCTLGVRESRDLMEVIADTYRRYGEHIYLGLHGESMGSGLQITALKYHPNVSFIVNDCGYADLMGVLCHKAKKEFHLPAWTVRGASIMSRVIFGYAFTEVRPIDSLAENTSIPICFVHGTDDDFVTVDHSERMYAAAKGYREFHLYEGAGHAHCLASDPERYFRMLSSFLEKAEALNGR